MADLKNASKEFQGEINECFNLEEISQTCGERVTNKGQFLLLKRKGNWDTQSMWPGLQWHLWHEPGQAQSMHWTGEVRQQACRYSVKQSKHSGKYRGLSPLLPNRIDVTEGKTVWRFQPQTADCLTHNAAPLPVAAAWLDSGKSWERSTVCWIRADEVQHHSFIITHLSQQLGFPSAERQRNTIVRVEFLQLGINL